MTEINNITSFDMFGLPEIPTFILCNPNKEELYSLGAISERKYSPRFNTFSELSFRADKYVQGQEMGYYEYLSHRRLILVKDVGYFMIVGVSEKGNGVTQYKEIECKSLEVELVTKKVSLFSGTYKFYDIISPDGTLMGTILSYLPGWSMGTINDTVTGFSSKYRTFDVSDTTIYNFLMTDIEEAYECVFTFDTENKKINVYDVAGATVNTDIYISFDNVMQNINIDESTDELITSLTVLGGGGLEINRVNPLGTNNIYNFTYFKSTDWMEQSLINAIEAWETKYDAQQPIYAGHYTNLLNSYEELLTLQSELGELQTELAVLEVELAGYIRAANSSQISITKSSITTKKSQISTKKTAIQNKQNQINTIISNMEVISDDLSLDNTSNFTQAQQVELQPFIIQSSFINEYFIQTDSMTYVEVQEEAQALFNQASGVLENISEPRYTFDIDSVNFMMIEAFQEFINQIDLGSIVYMEVEEGVTVQPVLLGMDLNYDNPTDFKLIFGNRLRLDDEAFQFSDLMDSALKASTNTKVNSRLWSNWNNTYKDDVTTFINSSLNAALNNVTSGSSQEVLIDQAGIRGRTILPDETYDPNQIWIVNNMIAFTDDNWSSAKMAIGEIKLSGGDNTFGIVGDYIVGRMIAGNTLTITNANSTFRVDGSGATLTDASLTINKGVNVITLNPSKGIEITRSGAKQFYVDTGGNVVFAGNLSAAGGTFSGNLSAAGGTFTGTLSGVNGNFTGTVSATYLSGTIDWGNVTGFPNNFVTSDQISSLVANKLAGGTLSGTYGLGGRLNVGDGSIMAIGTAMALYAGGNPTAIVYSHQFRVQPKIVCTGDIYADSTSLVATQSWANGQFAYKTHYHSQYYQSGSNPSFGTVSASNRYNCQGYSGASTTIYVGPSYSNKAITVRGGIITGWSFV